MESPPAEAQKEKDNKHEPAAEKTHYGWRFWVIFAGLSLTALVSALDGTIVSTALPSIVRDLQAGDDYIWVVNVYFLTAAAFQPLYGQLANIWGRRYLMISVVAIFTLGSGICGGANSTGMLIAGRAVQGVGAGGINMIVDMIICDLVPLRERSNFVGLLFAIISMGGAIGPFVGGVMVQHASWRWVFYINLPFGGAAMALLFIFLRVNWEKTATFKDKIVRIDWIGNAILIASTFAVLWALTYGGTRYSWSSGRVIAPLILGLIGLLLFMSYEMSSFPKEPVVPPHLFANRTSSAAFFISFQHALLTFYIIYFLPVYFQSVLGASPTRSGVDLLVLVLVFPVFAAVAGGAVAKSGRYKPVHLAGFAILTVGIGCLSLLDRNSKTGVWVVLQIIVAAGLGALISCLLPAVQAELDESETATSTATWAFIRSLGTIWGVSIPAAIFNNRFDQLLHLIDDPAVRARLSNGKAYESASAALIRSFEGATRDQVIHVFTQSLKRVWYIGVVFGGVSFLAVFLEKEVQLRTELDTKFGMEKREKVDEGEAR